MVRICRHLFDTNFFILSPNAKVIWIFAATRSESDGLVNIHTKVLPRLVGLSEADGIEALCELQKHNFYDNDQPPFLVKFEDGIRSITKILPWYCRQCEVLVRASIPIDLRAVVLSTGCCAHCGATENLEVDHIRPVSLGGGSEIENLQPLCRTCNRKKLNRFIG